MVDASVPDITLEFDKALKMDEMDFTGKDDLSDESIIVYHTKIPRLMALSSSTEENDIYDWQEKSDEETEWKQVTGRSSLIYQHMKRNFGTDFDVLQFRKNIIDRLLDEMPTEPLNLKPKRGTALFLQNYPGTARKLRKRCRECYKNLSARRGRTIAPKKIEKSYKFFPSNKTIADGSHRWYTLPDKAFAWEPPVVDAVLNDCSKYD
uniref:Uncharacterized protein n=1 Tax=Glossina palpalis gambiensis TaxID=67801 RepID=A0A1B0BXG4_9MUSC